MVPHSLNTRGYVLSGGASSRFGRDKALVRFGAIPLLFEIVQLAQTCTSEVAVVARAQKYADLGGNFEIIEDRWPVLSSMPATVTKKFKSSSRIPRMGLNLSAPATAPAPRPL